MPKWYPLDWPVGHPRSDNQGTSRFKCAFDRSIEETRQELRRLGATGVCVSTNLQTARDGWPDPRSPLKGRDPGVAVYWILGGKQHVIACDAWDRVEDNLHAITLTIAADRGKVRWGCSAVLERSMAAYLSLPGPAAARPWWDVLECRRDSSLETIERQYRARIRTAHPDAGGSHDRTAELNRALEEARKEKSNVA